MAPQRSDLRTCSPYSRAFAMISAVLGDFSAPWIQSKLQRWGKGRSQTVLASSPGPKSGGAVSARTVPLIETATPEELRQMAENGSAAAENALGLRYAQGDEKNGIVQDETEAFRWFSKAAEDGSLEAQTKLSSLYWSGRGTPQDLNMAYFWSVLARARGDEASKYRAAALASRMTRSQAAELEQKADVWLQQHPAVAKPPAGQ